MDNPTVMQSMRREFGEKYYWVQLLFCFLHVLNTIIGKISSFSEVKPIITKSARIVSFFNSSHYWGGQLREEAKKDNATQKLTTKTETWWYSLIQQCLSILSHK
ncbi:hypothetical protein CC1G_13294 [Coprinopsis cinerea okayama7|uniref:DUF659 domain-containing protein n=1 Tax=Coprinopsis cinerea (strain Okayama-7 / 130 / ATCC MYA-4618 / FGSC 9003) TaxID=240176 RepID=A8PHC8_COPC7|nr:hypothetical protein CC1G_13294 [Coprinopsis cinerea okayama7\|eukprot:XP_001841384.2 hypothetical protein CC1G_13294 [Coprinopsis cinerea okayama7\